MRRLEASIPLSMAEVQADKDLLRAEFAMSTRRLETNVEQLRIKSANQLAELGRKGDAINRLNIELGTLRDRLSATEQEFTVKATAVHGTEDALSERESELAKQMRDLTERSTLADARKIAIIALNTEVEALKVQLGGASNKLKMVHDRSEAAMHEARRALSEKESELAQRMRELEEHSSIVDAQKIEISKLNSGVEVLKQQLHGASNELKALQDRRDVERIELKTATEKLVEERSKFERFHRRVTELVQQLMEPSIQDKNLSRRAQELENRFIEQSQLLKERELKLNSLYGEIANARRAEAELRSEIDARANAATQTLNAEKAKLQAAFDRANGERLRLAFELARIKRQVDNAGVAERIESPMLGDVAAGGTVQMAYGPLQRGANSDLVTLVPDHDDRGIH
jgi:chromosome segregation ATPase